jgi:hypothetical protein
MRTLIVSIVAVLVAGCASMGPYWSRSGATRSQLIDESGMCYRASIDDDYPAALPGPGSTPRLLPRSEPPPALWTRAPRQAGLERFDEQQRYERCMHARGWVPGRASTPAL